MTYSLALRLFLFILGIGSGLSGMAQLAQQPYEYRITGVENQEYELLEAVSVRFEPSASSLLYRVSSSLQFVRGNGLFVISEQGATQLMAGEYIGPNSRTFTNTSTLYNWVLPLHFYNWEVRFPGNHMFVYPMRDYFPGQTNILIGFARQHPVVAGTQYGWVRLQRETADTKQAFREDGSQKQITFMPTAFAVNPIPDQPIRAGEPPDLPQLISEVLPPEDGLPTRVRVSWASGWASMRLESAVELGNPVQWSPVFQVTGTEAVFELPEDGQLYLRLAYVP
jgi:hypothetical protein